MTERIFQYAYGKFIEDVDNLIDDPYGMYEEGKGKEATEEAIRQGVEGDFRPLAEDLGIDLDEWLSERGTPHERDRLAKILKGGTA